MNTNLHDDALSGEFSLCLVACHTTLPAYTLRKVLISLNRGCAYDDCILLELH